MVVSKKIHCAVCNKKCFGNVLRYQDQYYHKQCFEQDTDVANKLQDNIESETSIASDKDQQLKRQQQHIYTHSVAPSSLNSDPIYHVDDPHSSHHQDNSNEIISLVGSNSNLRQSHSQQQQQQQHRHQPASKGTAGGQTNGIMRPTVGSQQQQLRSQTIDARNRANQQVGNGAPRSATLPHSTSAPANGLHAMANAGRQTASCAGCGERINDGQALIALDLHWHVWCFKCTKCRIPLHNEYVAKDGRAYCEKDYQKLFGVTCVYCKRYITGKVLQAGEAHHFHPSCARCSKCGDPFVPGEEMYLQSEITWHPRCGPGPDNGTLGDELTALDSSGRSQLRQNRAQSPSLSSRSRSASPFSYMSRQYGRSSPGYADSEAVGDLSRIYTISYLNADPTQGYLRRPIEPNPPKSPQFSRPTSSNARGGGDRSRSSSRSHYRERSVPRGMYSVLSSMRSGSSVRARSPSMMNEEAIQLAQYPSGQKPSPDAVPKIERDDFPAPPFPYPERARSGAGSVKGDTVTGQETRSKQQLQQPQGQQQRASRPRSREIIIDDEESSQSGDDQQLRKEEEELSKIASGIGKIFLQTLKEREKLRAWKRANLDPRNASRTPSATRELPSRPLRYDNPTGASPSRDMDRPRPWDDDDPAGDHSPTRTRSSLGKPSQMSASSYGYKVIQSNRSTPKPGYGLSGSSYAEATSGTGDLSFIQQQRIAQNRSNDLLMRSTLQTPTTESAKSISALANCSPHLRRSMPNVNLQHHHHHHVHQDGPPKLYPYHLLATSNYRLPPDVDRCHLERHLSNDEFQYIFHCDRLDFYHLPEWKRNELKRRAKLF